MRAKLPKGRGSWAAFWLLASKQPIDWPTDGEIDILGEFKAYDKKKLILLLCIFVQLKKSTSATIRVVCMQQFTAKNLCPRPEVPRTTPRPSNGELSQLL